MSLIHPPLVHGLQQFDAEPHILADVAVILTRAIQLRMSPDIEERTGTRTSLDDLACKATVLVSILSLRHRRERLLTHQFKGVAKIGRGSVMDQVLSQ